MNASHAAVTAHLEWMTLRGMSPNTITFRRRLLANLAGHLPVELLAATPGHLAVWRAGLTVAPQTVTHYVSHAKSFYRGAARERLGNGNPAPPLPVPLLGALAPRTSLAALHKHVVEPNLARPSGDPAAPRRVCTPRQSPGGANCTLE